MPTTSPFTASTSFATPALSVNPANFSEAVELLNDYVQTTVAPGATTYIVSETAPSGLDQDKLWVKIKPGNGVPVGLFFYWNGYWRRVDQPRPFSIHIFSGDPSTYFDSNGQGYRGVDYDGYVLMNGGTPGIPDLTDRFIVAGGAYTAGAWTSKVTDNATALPLGGTYERTFSIGDANLPSIDIGGSQLVDLSGANEADQDVIIDDHHSTNPNKQHTVHLAGQNPPDPITLNIIPPFYAMAYIMWLGYDAY